MNVRFPKAKYFIAALGKIGIASLISVRVALLNGVQGVCVDCGVGVPKVAVPLNNQSLVSIEGIHNKLAADDLLLCKVNADTFQDGAPSLLKYVCFFVGGESQNAVDPLHIGMVIAASVRAILDRSFESPTRHIERIAACRALLRVTATAGVDRVLSRNLFGFCRVLPNVRAIYRTERNGTAATGHKLLATVAARVSATFVATLGIIRVRQERLIAFFADALVARDVFHAFIIPWSVAKCN